MQQNGNLKAFDRWNRKDCVSFSIPVRFSNPLFIVLVRRLRLIGVFNIYHYRPQRSCGKVMFSQASVILFTEGRAWQVVYMAGRHMWRGGAMHGRGGMGGRGCAWQGWHAWQERWPLQRTARILLECILVVSCLSFLCCLEIVSQPVFK